MPTRLHPAKLATPLVAFFGLAVQLSVPDEGVSVIGAEAVATTALLEF